MFPPPYERSGQCRPVRPVRLRTRQVGNARYVLLVGAIELVARVRVVAAQAVPRRALLAVELDQVADQLDVLVERAARRVQLLQKRRAERGDDRVHL